MSKGLEALNRGEHINYGKFIIDIKDKDIIEKELKEKDKLNEHLSNLDNALMSGFKYKDKIICACSLEHYDNLAKKEQVLEIIKRPDFDFNWFKTYGINLNYEDFIMIMNLKCNIKSKKEYDLLKEVLV